MRSASRRGQAPGPLIHPTLPPVPTGCSTPRHYPIWSAKFIRDRGLTYDRFWSLLFIICSIVPPARGQRLCLILPLSQYRVANRFLRLDILVDVEEVARVVVVLESNQALVVGPVCGLHQHRLLPRIIHEVEVGFTGRE